jgi:hypothetical protein
VAMVLECPVLARFRGAASHAGLAENACRL